MSDWKRTTKEVPVAGLPGGMGSAIHEHIPLIKITVQDYAQTPFARMIADSGVQVSGVFTDAGESASTSIGLDEGMAGRKFKESLIKAAQAAKK